MTFAEFRLAFVRQFLTTASPEALQAKIALIESMCSDFSEGIIDEATLKTNLLESVRVEALAAAVAAGHGIQYGDSFGDPMMIVEMTGFPLWNSSRAILPNMRADEIAQPVDPVSFPAVA